MKVALFYLTSIVSSAFSTLATYFFFFPPQGPRWFLLFFFSYFYCLLLEQYLILNEAHQSYIFVCLHEEIDIRCLTPLRRRRRTRRWYLTKPRPRHLKRPSTTSSTQFLLQRLRPLRSMHAMASARLSSLRLA